MKNLLLSSFLSCCLLLACTPATPEKCFDVAVLNSNMVVGFADDGELRELEQPTVKATDSKGGYAPMKRSEVVDQKIQFVEENLKKLQGLQKTDDNKAIMETSLALHQYILPVYKTDYTELAKLYDTGAPTDQVQAKAEAIHDKYYAHFDALYNQLISDGKAYADRHGIKVNWAQ